MEQTLGETLLEIRNCLTEFVFLSHRYICKPLRVNVRIGQTLGGNSRKINSAHIPMVGRPQ